MKRSVLALLLVAACADDGQPYAAPEPDEVLFGTVFKRERPTIDGRDLTAVVDAQRRLALDLMRLLREAKPGENLALGVYSINQVLGMLYAGARGQTAAEMATALGWALPPERLHPALNALDLELAKRREDVTLTIANRVWAQRGLPVKTEFLDVLTASYGAPLAITDFAGDATAARAEINDWVRRVTLGKIPELFPAGAIVPSTRVVLANAMYLDAPWKYKLDPARTSSRPFRLANGTTVDVSMMHYGEYLPTSVGDDYSAVELPYRGDELSMVVIVPGAIASFEASLTVEKLNRILADIEDGGVHLSMPKLELKVHNSLVEPLRTLGMPSLFEDADLSGISDADLVGVSHLEHEVYLQVDEEGTKAAAATGAVVVDSHGPTIQVDRPFLFLLLDRPTGAILFIGRVLDPRPQGR